MATVPTPLDATAAVKITATSFDAGVRDPLNFLLDPPKCDLAMNTALLHVNGTATLETYDTESVDSDSMHSTSSNPSRVIFTTQGRYHLGIFVFMPQVPTTYGTYTVNLRLNSGGSSAGGTSIRSFSYGSPGGAPAQSNTNMTRVFSAGDYVEVFVTQISGSDRITNASLGVYANGFQARWVSIN
jgi:hypothetical protein